MKWYYYDNFEAWTFQRVASTVIIHLCYKAGWEIERWIPNILLLNVLKKKKQFFFSTYCMS